MGSGTSQHIVHFAAHFPLATFQPPDIDPIYLKSIQAYINEYEVNAFTKKCITTFINWCSFLNYTY